MLTHKFVYRLSRKNEYVQFHKFPRIKHEEEQCNFFNQLVHPIPISSVSSYFVDQLNTYAKW